MKRLCGGSISSNNGGAYALSGLASINTSEISETVLSICPRTGIVEEVWLSTEA
jgi:hypothetical protein